MFSSPVEPEATTVTVVVSPEFPITTVMMLSSPVEPVDDIAVSPVVPEPTCSGELPSPVEPNTAETGADSSPVVPDVLLADTEKSPVEPESNVVFSSPVEPLATKVEVASPPSSPCEVDAAVDMLEDSSPEDPDMDVPLPPVTPPGSPLLPAVEATKGTDSEASSPVPPTVAFTDDGGL